MHYVPESAREFLQDSSSESTGDATPQNFHLRSAPVYILTTVVGALLAADLLIGFLAELGQSDWLAYRAVGGYRLALFAALLGGSRILYQTLEGLTEGKIGADLALTIACLAAIVLKEPVTAALVVFVALCGESIEGYTVDRAQRAIRRVFQITPTIAHVIRGNRETDIPVGEVEIGDTVIVRPGERVPVDGQVIDGISAIDESALTGESIPVDKTNGDSVFSGSINQFGSLTITAEKVGNETTLAQIIRLVSEATERKAPLERTADRLARLFLPIVLAVAGITLIGWRIKTGEWTPGFMPALSVLVVACPCPLILATPSAVMAAMAWLARTGVVVKGSVALERLAQIDTIAFDKTGTLTRGELQVADIRTFGDLNETELLRTASIAEKRSEHAIGRMIVREAEARGCIIPGVYDFSAKPGFGIIAEVATGSLGEWALQQTNSETRQHQLLVGNRRLLEDNDFAFPASVESAVDELESNGQTVVIVGLDREVLGIIGTSDTIRADSLNIIGELRQSGIEQFAILTGDRPAASEVVAQQVGLSDSLETKLLPADKANWIERQTNEGRRVAMVGDGVNDAPALATATVGVALGGVGSDIAAEAGDLVLMGDPLRPLPGLLRLSRQLVRNIRQSIFLFAFGMNAMGMLLGAVGILSPVAAAVFHEFSSLAVMFNALRLLWFERFETTMIGRWLESTNRWQEQIAVALSPTQFVFRVLRHWSLIVRLTATAIAVAWLLSGLTLVADHQQAVVTRFGRFHKQLSSGVHWRWPAPFERVYREDVERVRSVQLGFQESAAVDMPESVIIPAVEWTSDHDADSISGESLALTGEEVLVEFTGEVHFKIDDLYRYVFTSSAPEDTVRAVAESAIREATSRFSLDSILTSERARIEQECRALTRQFIADYQIGVEITDFHLLEVHPPKQVVPDYRQVADALEQREQLINQAEAYYAREVLNAAGEDAIRLLNASVDNAQQRQDSSTTGEVAAWKLDDVLWKKLNVQQDGRPRLLAGAAAAELLQAEQEKVSQVESAKGEAIRFNKLLETFRGDSRLTSKHLYWRTVDRTLSDRPLTIVDPKVTGKQHLLLANPLQLNAPSILPQIAPSPTTSEQSEPLIDANER